MNKVIDIIYREVQKKFKFDQMGVFLVGSSDKRLHMTQEAGLPLNPKLEKILVQDGLPLDASNSLIAASVVNQETIYRQSISQETIQEAGVGDQQIYRLNKMKSILLCPLSVEGNAIGCIFFNASSESFDLSKAEIDSIERYVTQLGTAIRNSQLFQMAEDSRRDAETANQTKGTFLANMSHEIRTPMNAIIGLTGLCLDSDLDTKQKDYLTKVSGAANALRTIIDDILDFSKLEAGKMEIEKIPFSLNDVLDNLATICMVRCQVKNLELVFDRDPNLPDSLFGDPTRLGQILINLAGNAIKFTEQGYIVVEVKQVSRAGDQVVVRFDVRDSGIGMNKEQLSRMFQSFSQADSSISRQYGGTGLGLAISQQLTEAMGGLIEVSSEPGVGSSFHFTLSFEAVGSTAHTLEIEAAPQNLNVLVVDDNEPTRIILQEYLESFGYGVTLVESGEQALEFFQSRHNFDLVLLDWMMPGMTGLDVGLAIRETLAPPKIILLSAWTLPSNEHLEQFDAFLAKPIKPSSLLDTIMQVYGIQITRHVRNLKSSIGPEDLSAIRGARVLVVDDSEINLQIACELLAKVPLVLDTASEGEEAIRKVSANHYEAILMDIQMPGMDGYSATRVIRQDYDFEQLPILAMTANVMPEDKKRATEAGMNGHVGKPVDPSELYKALADVIVAADYSGNLPEQEASEKSPETSANVSSIAATFPGLDTRAGLRSLAGNEQLYLQLLQNLFEEYTNTGPDLEDLLQEGKTVEIREISHKLRGIANNLGAFNIGKCAEDIEKAILSDQEVSKEKIDQLSEALEEAGESVNLIEAQVAVNQPDVGSSVDVSQLLSEFRQAIISSNPTAIDLVGQLLAVHKLDDKVTQLLERSRESLDNFNFAEVEPLLAEIEEMLSV